MSTFGKDYYFILSPDVDSLPSLTPDEDTSENPIPIKRFPSLGNR
jgi:hypothetical protein